MDLIFQATMSHDYMISLIAIWCYVDKKHSRKLHGRWTHALGKGKTSTVLNYDTSPILSFQLFVFGATVFPLLSQQGPIDLAQPGSLQRFGRI